MIEIEGSAGAFFDSTRNYRYLLWRVWDDEKPATMFVGLNPSTADEIEDDPTVRRCINYARAWGSGALYMANLFSWRSTDPSVLKKLGFPVGPRNWEAIHFAAPRCRRVIAAWGTHGKLYGTDIRFVEQYLTKVGLPPLQCLGINSDGTPKHPLYLKSSELPRDYVCRRPY